MPNESLEERIKHLEDINEIQNKKIQHLEAAHEVQNLMSKYEYYLAHGMCEEALDAFALKTPGVRVELGSWGLYEGSKGVRRIIVDCHSSGSGDQASSMKPGRLNMMPNTSPVIEVAGDGKTAKGIWICPGIETHPEKGKELQATWSWCKRAADFVKEDGKWKIWHYSVYSLLRTPFEKSWVDTEEPIPTVETSPFPKELGPDKPARHPSVVYHPMSSLKYIPEVPEPYETFDEAKAY